MICESNAADDQVAMRPAELPLPRPILNGADHVLNLILRELRVVSSSRYGPSRCCVIRCAARYEQDKPEMARFGKTAKPGYRLSFGLEGSLESDRLFLDFHKHGRYGSRLR